MSMTSCDLLLASSGASSSTVAFHPFGVLSNGMILPVSTLYANARSGPNQSRCPCCVRGLTAVRGRLTLCLSRFSRQEFAFCISGHKQTSTLAPYNRLARCRVLYSGFRVPMTPVPLCCWMPCWHHRPGRCRVESTRDLSASLV